MKAVHPRVCGERRSPVEYISLIFGSSPRVRGTRIQEADRLGPTRFIPACAGNAPTIHGGERAHSVHPRVCGERLGKKLEASDKAGSSPRVRGTHRHCQQIHLVERFIPACAGNAPRASQIPRHRAVHPRVCGERRPAVQRSRVQVGSSPRVRGTQAAALQNPPQSRFIPACAGNASTGRWPARWRPVHPRVCGERFVSRRVLLLQPGSSPRVRGTLMETRIHADQFRFIPACAGNAGPRLSDLRVMSVHPRVCGERAAGMASGMVRSGSSPRVRGTPGVRLADDEGRRFIPACAGNAD